MWISAIPLPIETAGCLSGTACRLLDRQGRHVFPMHTLRACGWPLHWQTPCGAGMSTRFSDQVPTRLGHCCGRRRLKSTTLSKTGDFSPSHSRSLHPAAPLSAADFIATGARATPLPRHWRRRFCLPPARPPRPGPDTGILPWPLTGSDAATLPPECRQQPKNGPYYLTAGQRRFSISPRAPTQTPGVFWAQGLKCPGPWDAPCPYGWVAHLRQGCALQPRSSARLAAAGGEGTIGTVGANHAGSGRGLGEWRSRGLDKGLNQQQRRRVRGT